MMFDDFLMFFDWLNDWLIDWMIDWLIDWIIDTPTGAPGVQIYIRLTEYLTRQYPFLYKLYFNCILMVF